MIDIGFCDVVYGRQRFQHFGMVWSTWFDKGWRPLQSTSRLSSLYGKKKRESDPIYCVQHSTEDGILHGFVARFFFFPSVFVLLGLFVLGGSLGGLSRVISLGGWFSGGGFFGSAAFLSFTLCNISTVH